MMGARREPVQCQSAAISGKRLLLFDEGYGDPPSIFSISPLRGACEGVVRITGGSSFTVFSPHCFLAVLRFLESFPGYSCCCSIDLPTDQFSRGGHLLCRNVALDGE